MKIKFQVDVWPEVLASIPTLLAKFGFTHSDRAILEGIEDVVGVLEACKGSPELVLLKSLIEFDAADLPQIDYFQLWTKKRAALTLPAWEATFEGFDAVNPVDRGGRSPVSQPVGLTYASGRKEPHDLAVLMEGSQELVVSDAFLDFLQSVDPEVYGEPLYSGKRKTGFAVGVKLLASSRFALPALMTRSVGRFKGLAANPASPEYPDANMADLGIEVLPADPQRDLPKIMRSAEAWTIHFGAGWVLNRVAAERVAAASKNVLLHPLLTASTPLHAQHEAFWQEALAATEPYPNARWGFCRSVTDVAPMLRPSAKPSARKRK